MMMTVIGLERITQIDDDGSEVSVCNPLPVFESHRDSEAVTEEIVARFEDLAMAGAVDAVSRRREE